MASKAKKEVKLKKFQTLDAAIGAVVKRYESQAEAARQLEIGKTYMCRMLSGAKDNPSEEVLARMGITRHVHYTAEV